MTQNIAIDDRNRDAQSVRESWALELTRANQLEAQVPELRAAAGRAAVNANNRLAEVKAAHEAELSALRQQHANEISSYRAFVHGVWEECFVEYHRPHTLEDIRDWIADEIKEGRPDALVIFEDCDVCEGRGHFVETELVGSGGRPESYGEQAFAAECGHCVHGRVPR